MSTQNRDFKCGGWTWDPVRRELRFHERKGRDQQGEPVQVEKLRLVNSVTLHKWSQAPMRSPAGRSIPGHLSRIVIRFEDGGDITINENDRQCARLLAEAVATTYNLDVEEAGAPGERRPSILPIADRAGRLVSRLGSVQAVVDRNTGEIIETRGRFLGKKRRIVQFANVRRLELHRRVKGSTEQLRLTAIYGPEEERVLVAGYEGFEGWSSSEVWHDFGQSMARAMGNVEVVELDTTSDEPRP